MGDNTKPTIMKKFEMILIIGAIIGLLLALFNMLRLIL